MNTKNKRKSKEENVYDRKYQEEKGNKRKSEEKKGNGSQCKEGSKASAGAQQKNKGSSRGPKPKPLARVVADEENHVGSAGVSHGLGNELRRRLRSHGPDWPARLKPTMWKGAFDVGGGESPQACWTRLSGCLDGGCFDMPPHLPHLPRRRRRRRLHPCSQGHRP